MLIRATKGLAFAFKNAFIETIKQTFLLDSMTYSDALKIMYLNRNFSDNELDFKFESFYKSNSKENGGSIYIQNRIKDAYFYLKKNRH